MSKAWFQQRERGSPLMIGIILWVAQHIGRSVARLLLWPITLYFFVFAGQARRASRDYLQRLHGRPAGNWQVLRHIHCFSATILDRVFILGGQFERFQFEYHGLDTLQQELGQGRGVIMLGSHLGSFEVLRVLAMQQRQLRMKVLMYQDHNQYLTRLFNRLNPEVAASVIPLGSPQALLQVKETLEQGMGVGMLGDRVAQSEKLTRCDFLGAQAEFPAGPALLAEILRTPVVLAFGLYLGGNRYAIHIEAMPPVEVEQYGGRDAAVQAWMQHYALRLEHYARLAPYNWFNFYDYWRA